MFFTQKRQSKWKKILFAFDKVAVSGLILEDGYASIGPLQWRRSGSDSCTPAVCGTFPNLAQKIVCLKNSLKFPKNVFGNKIKKANSVYAIILIIWRSGFSHSWWLPYCVAFE